MKNELNFLKLLNFSSSFTKMIQEFYLSVSPSVHTKEGMKSAMALMVQNGFNLASKL